MNDYEFLTLVKKMREAQKMYDRTKHYIYFDEMKGFSKLVDDHIINVEKKRIQDAQKKFFSDY